MCLSAIKNDAFYLCEYIFDNMLLLSIELEYKPKANHFFVVWARATLFSIKTKWWFHKKTFFNNLFLWSFSVFVSFCLLKFGAFKVFNKLKFFSLCLYKEPYSEPCQTSFMESFAKPLTIFTKHSTFYVWQGSEYASDKCFLKVLIRFLSQISLSLISDLKLVKRSFNSSNKYCREVNA